MATIQVREYNLERTLGAIRSSGPSTTSELTRATGLSRPSINSLVSELVRLGWVDVVEPVLDGQGGRPPQRFAFRSRAGLLVGLDIGVHRISVLLADLDGGVLVEHQVAVDPALAPPERLEAIDRTLGEALAEHGASPHDVWAVGAAVTGPVDATGRTSLFSPLPGWTDVDLVGHLATTFPCPVRVENDVKLALLAEHAWGAAQGADDVVYILAGLRTGAAAFVNGVLVKGHAGAAGEIGRLPVVRWKKAIGILRGDHAGDDDLDVDATAAATTFETARRGDPGARRLVREYARAVATGASALVLTLDPEVVVLGGGSTPWAELWVPEFSAMVGRSVIRMPDVRVSTLGGDHVARGAVRLAMSEVESSHLTGEIRPARARASDADESLAQPVTT
ncbi:transcriptional regulator/sugar kinase [Sanguibacter keddieii DSM 10542]|uniref:Transcriptional regulator/sugar kinase n=1 Tax=Sanguibacter keddieii (strain ATCC 51767 / DSM 10542 / NCFB 3025 / ST-74) TaxID=446469 RepID=D1BIW6_SANKS|nr:ROK family transcriptional regulator [Sanguibacter keddieii]ACZ20158.1 transcriptional regulator/sugar kinase [Sanguibacter keddieii DSM 10542]